MVRSYFRHQKEYICSHVSNIPGDIITAGAIHLAEEARLRAIHPSLYFDPLKEFSRHLKPLLNPAKNPAIYGMLSHA